MLTCFAGRSSSQFSSRERAAVSSGDVVGRRQVPLLPTLLLLLLLINLQLRQPPTGIKFESLGDKSKHHIDLFWACGHGGKIFEFAFADLTSKTGHLRTVFLDLPQDIASVTRLGFQRRHVPKARWAERPRGSQGAGAPGRTRCPSRTGCCTSHWSSPTTWGKYATRTCCSCSKFSSNSSPGWSKAM